MRCTLNETDIVVLTTSQHLLKVGTGVDLVFRVNMLLQGHERRSTKKHLAASRKFDSILSTVKPRLVASTVIFPPENTGESNPSALRGGHNSCANETDQLL